MGCRKQLYGRAGLTHAQVCIWAQGVIKPVCQPRRLLSRAKDRGGGGLRGKQLQGLEAHTTLHSHYFAGVGSYVYLRLEATSTYGWKLRQP